MAEEFFTQADDEQFKSWLAQHSHGFYLNEGQVGNVKRSQGGMMLHKAACYHLGDGAGIISTTYAKAASHDRQELFD